MAKKEYKSFRQVLAESNLADAIRYKVFELRDKSPLVNKILSLVPNRINSSGYALSYSVYWDYKGRLKEFDPYPKFN